MLENSWFKKEKPLLGLIGMGGGASGHLFGGGPSGIEATGGTTHEDTTNKRKIHVFTFPNSDNFVVADAPGSATLSVLSVGGGGGAGHYGGGGGAGGWVYVDDFPFSPGTYNITVGDGGLSGNPPNHPSPTYTNRNFLSTQGAHGAPSTFGSSAGGPAYAGLIGGPYATDSVVAYGGGGGGGNNSGDAHHGVVINAGASQPGSVYFGSSGGASSQNSPGARSGGSTYAPAWPTTGPTAVPALTRNNIFHTGGGTATYGLGQPVSDNTGAGGGGAGGAGSNPPGSGKSGAGGSGKSVPATFLPSPYAWLPNPFLGLAQPAPDFNQFAGGGTGQGQTQGGQIAGGSGGGGAGGSSGNDTQGVDGRGGGGGVSEGGNNASPGGDGVVIVSYPTA